MYFSWEYSVLENAIGRSWLLSECAMARPGPGKKCNCSVRTALFSICQEFRFKTCLICDDVVVFCRDTDIASYTSALGSQHLCLANPYFWERRCESGYNAISQRIIFSYLWLKSFVSIIDRYCVTTHVHLGCLFVVITLAFAWLPITSCFNIMYILRAHWLLITCLLLLGILSN